MFRSKRTAGLVFLMLAIVLVGTPIIGNLPVHRTNIQYTDSLGDIQEPNFDIIQIKSHLVANNIVLELTVAGLIQITDSNISHPDFLYRIIIVGKHHDGGQGHIYACTYSDGVIQQYGFDFEVDNSTLRIFFPLTAFIPDSYMIGLEGATCSPFEEDLTPEDRDSSIARLLFN